MPHDDLNQYNPEWSDIEIEGLESVISNMRDQLPKVGDFIVPGFDKLASEVLADWEAEHRHLVEGRDRFRAEQRRKQQ